MIAAASCNQVFDIASTDPATDSFDIDADGVDDDVDNCLDVANPDQADRDVDGVGDVCDNCPMVTGSDQHDEDHDGIGDPCDPCPTIRDFGVDMDGDGVGDLCEPDSRPTVRSYFDPFVTVRPELMPGAVPWVAADDEIAPVAVLPVSDPGLRAPGVVLTSIGWSVRVFTRSAKRWDEGERFGVRARNVVTGQVAASCIISCTDTATCEARLSTETGPGSVQLMPAAAVPEVVVRLVASYEVAATKAKYACIMLPLPTLKVEASGVTPPTVSPEVLASPNVHLKNLEAVQ